MKKFILFAICLFLGNVWMSVYASAADNRQYNCTVNYRYAGKTGSPLSSQFSVVASSDVAAMKEAESKKRKQVNKPLVIDIVSVNCKPKF